MNPFDILAWMAIGVFSLWTLAWAVILGTLAVCHGLGKLHARRRRKAGFTL